MIATALYITIYAILFSLLEIEAEGKHGWAKKLPTVPALFTMTTYHVIMNIMVIFTLIYSLYPNNIFTIIFFIVAWKIFGGWIVKIGIWECHYRTILD